MIAETVAFPRDLASYPAVPGGLLQQLAWRADADPLNVVATAIFAAAIVHTFGTSRITRLAHDVQYAADRRAEARHLQLRPSVRAEALHLLGEVEVVFGLWAVVLLAAVAVSAGWAAATRYVDRTVNYTEPMFVVVIMALASTRPIIGLAAGVLGRLARAGGGTPAAWWAAILIVGPLLGSFITEPAAMTISALLLSRQFYDRRPSVRLRYATLGLLFVNVSIGGTLTHFAAPPVLMVAREWGWGTRYMLEHFGWRALVAIVGSTGVYFALFRSEFRDLTTRPDAVDVEEPDAEAAGTALLPAPWWIAAAHVAFIAWTVVNAHYPALFLGGFLFFLGFARATSAYQARLELRVPLLVGFFLAGLVIHGGLQGWWIAPILASLPEGPLFVGAAGLTAVNDNALITYLATLVPNLPEALKRAVVEGAVVGGGLTVIANAPNPAGQAILARFFPDAISPFGLLAAAMVPTIVAAIAFRLL